MQTNFEFLCELDRKLDQLHHRIEELAISLGAAKSRKFAVQPLNGREKQCFVSLLKLTESMPQVSYTQLAQRLGWSNAIVAAYVAKLSEKGVPILKKMVNGMMYLCMDPLFREQQIKTNLVGVDAPLNHWME